MESEPKLFSYKMIKWDCDLMHKDFNFLININYIIIMIKIDIILINIIIIF